VARDEIDVEHALASRLGRVVRSEHVLTKADEHSDVAARTHLMVLLADLRLASGQHLHRVLRIDEIFEPLLPHGIEGDDGRAPFGDVFERMQKARAVRPGVLAEEEHRVAFGEVVEDHGPDPDADRRLQRHRRRFVAHVRTVGKVVAPVHARKQGIKV